MLGNRLYQGALVFLVPLAIIATDTARAVTPEDKLYEAYYLEREKGDYAAAEKLYAELASDRGVDDSVRAKAKARLAAVREEQVSTDFARLMPPEALAYVELREPGEKIVAFLDKLGLMSDPDRLPEAGAKRLAVSPELIKGVLGIRGLAAVVTGFDPATQRPSGVMVFNPGDIGVIRGLIQTALPVAAAPAEPIGGFPTYNVENQAFVTLTSRLVIASTQRSQIEGVIERMKGSKQASLANSKALADLGKDREHALLLFFVNAEPVIPMIKQAMAQEVSRQEFAMAEAVLDIDSLRSLTGRIGLGQDGVGFDVALRMAEGHKSLAFNLLRTPAIDHDTLRCIPEGAAAFSIGALNEAPSRFRGTISPNAQPIVTLLDVGRELFANITSFAVYVLPPEGTEPDGGPPIPDVGVAITVNDPAKSSALWTQMLGIASLAAGTGGIEGTRATIEGVEVRTYRIPDGPVLYFTTMDHDVLLAVSRSAMARSIAAKKQGKSVLDDPAFIDSLSRLGPATTRALVAHAGRCARIARKFTSPGELRDVEPIMALLNDTTAMMVVDHSDELFRISFGVTGIPDVGNLVSSFIARKQKQHQRGAELTRAIQRENWDEAESALQAALDADPDDLSLLRKKFDLLALGKKDHAAAVECGEALAKAMQDSPRGLNRFAWALLTADKYGHAYNELALKMSRRSNEMTDYENWMFLDTLAVAEFDNGNVERAIELEKQAITECDGQGIDSLTETLARFESRHAEK